MPRPRLPAAPRGWGPRPPGRAALVLALLSSMLSLAACSADGSLYAPPGLPDHGVTATPATDRDGIMRAAKRVLESNGFVVTAADWRTGSLQTTLKPMPIGPREADCGSHMAIDYLLDEHTSARLGFRVSATDRFIAVHAVIAAVYAPADGHAPLALPCVSRGIFETEILQAVLAALPPG